MMVSESKVIVPVELNRLSPTLNTSRTWDLSGFKLDNENSIYYSEVSILKKADIK